MKNKMTTKEYIKEMASLTTKISDKEIDNLTNIIWRAGDSGNTIYLIGNGGSASTATHLAADISKNTISNHWSEDGKRLRALSLTDNCSWMTAIGNDQSYADIFVEQLKTFAIKGDVLMVVSGSGNSPNIVKSAVWAKQKGIKVLGLLGFDGGYLKDFVDEAIVVQSNDYGLVESVHSFIHHAIATKLMDKMKDVKEK